MYGKRYCERCHGTRLWRREAKEICTRCGHCQQAEPAERRRPLDP